MRRVGEGMVYMSYDGGWEGRAVPAALAGAAQLRAIFNTGIRENHLKGPKLQIFGSGVFTQIRPI
jgi:hypothetical protein